MLQVIDQLGREKGIDREVLIEAIEASIVHAAKKHLDSNESLEAHFNRETGKIELYSLKTVVEDVENGDLEISLEKNIRYLINPGSVGQPRDRNTRAACAVYDAEMHHIAFQLKDSSHHTLSADFLASKIILYCSKPPYHSSEATILLP